jgi:hypothetical protein
MGVEEDQLCLTRAHWETRMIFTIGLRLQQDLKVDALKLEVVLQVIVFLFSVSCVGGIGGLLVSTLVSHMILLVCLWIPCQALIGSLNLMQKEHSCIMINCMLLVGASALRSEKKCFLHLESPLQILLAVSVAIFCRSLILECELFVKTSVWKNGAEEVLV